MDYGCANKNICITGGTSGIGLEAACTFIRDGAKVLVAGSNSHKGIAAVQELEKIAREIGKKKIDGAHKTDGGIPMFAGAAPTEGARAAFCPVDVRSRSSCEELAAAVSQFFPGGKLDILVTSAGIYEEEPLAETTLVSYAKIMETNVAGTYWAIQALVPLMQEGSSIVTVGSDAGVSGNYGCPVYCASKGAVVALSKALALDLAPKIRVNCVCPGDVDTPLVKAQLEKAQGSYTKEQMGEAYPLGRIGSPQEIAHVICSVVSPANSFMTGAVLMADGGLTAK